MPTWGYVALAPWAFAGLVAVAFAVDALLRRSKDHIVKDEPSYYEEHRDSRIRPMYRRRGEWGYQRRR